MTTGSKSKVSNIEPIATILGSVNQIWLAGLGAFAVTQEEGGKLFESLVKEGEGVEAQTRKMASETIDEVKHRVEKIRDNAADQLDKLEQAFQNRVARALNRLGVPTNDDIRELAKRVEALNENIQRLSQPGKALGHGATAKGGVTVKS